MNQVPAQLKLPRQDATSAAYKYRNPTTTVNRNKDALFLLAVLLMTIFEGAARKWLFASSPMLRYSAYFSKDLVFVFAAYVGLSRGLRFDITWFLPCAVLILLPSTIGSVANSNLVGMGLSIRAYLVIPICAVLAAPLIRDFRDVERCALAVAISAVLVAGLGAYQYRLPKDHVVNRYDSGDEESHISANSGHVRATGTFSYIGGMSIMAGFSAWAGMFLILPIRGRKKWIRWVGVCALLAGLVCAAVSMSRSGLMFWAVTVMGGLLLYLRASNVLLLGLAVVALFAAFLGANPVEDLDMISSSDSLAHGLVDRIGNSDSFASRVGFVVDNFIAGITNYPFGAGIGVGQPGGAYASSGRRDIANIESEWGRVAFEVGIFGLLGVLLVRFQVGLICWRALRKTTDVHRRLILATALPFFGIMSLGWMAFNHVGSSAAWAVLTFALAAVPATERRTHAMPPGLGT